MTEAHRICVEFITAYFEQDQNGSFEFAKKILSGESNDFDGGIWLDGCGNQDMTDDCMDAEGNLCEGRVNPLFCMKHKTELKQ